MAFPAGYRESEGRVGVSRVLFPLRGNRFSIEFRAAEMSAEWNLRREEKIHGTAGVLRLKVQSLRHAGERQVYFAAGGPDVLNGDPVPGGAANAARILRRLACASLVRPNRSAHS